MAALNGWYALFCPFYISFSCLFLLFRRTRLSEGPDSRCRGWRSSYGSKMAPKHESWRRRLSSEAFLYDTAFFSRPTCHVAAVFSRRLHVVQRSHSSDQRLTARCPQEFLSTSAVGMLLSGFFYCGAPVLYQNLSIFISQTRGCVVICHQLCRVRGDSADSRHSSADRKSVV